MRRYFPALLSALLVVLIGGALWLTFKGFEPTEVAAELTQEHPQYEMENALWLRYGDDGQIEMRARADRIEYFDDRSMELSRVQIDRLSDEGPWVLVAARGQVPAQSQRMQLLPDVNVEGRRGGQPIHIHAPQVWLDWSRKTISSAKQVNMTSPGRTLSALGFEADWSGERLRFHKNVEMNYVAP